MDWLGDHTWAVWLAAALVLGGLELASLDLVLLMLSVGALAGMVAALAGLGLVAQILIGIAVSAAMLVFARPNFIRRLHTGPDLISGSAAMVGKHGFAQEQVTPHAGLVKVAGETWTARPYDDQAVIPEGARVQVLQIKGATAYVVEVPELGI
ncbi:MAG: NfeD family protein [Nocardioidaceae bacterium]